jgi:ABC-2 type transport system permease protein
MQSVLTLASKDLRLLFRDKMGLFFVAVFPLVYGVFFGLITGGSGDSGSSAVPVAVVDDDRSAISQKFIEALEKQGSLEVVAADRATAADRVRRGQLTAFVVLPKGFGETAGIFWMPGPAIELGIDPGKRAEGGMLEGLIMQAMGGMMRERFADPATMRQSIQRSSAEINNSSEMPPAQRMILSGFMGALDQFLGSFDAKLFEQNGPRMEPARIERVDVTAAQNPTQALLSKVRSPFEITFPSAIMWGIVGCVAGFAISLVKERTEGTLLRLKTAPISRGQILSGKAAACFMTAIGVIVFMLLLGRLFFRVRLSNPLGLALGSICTAACFTGLMMLLSVIGKTEHAVAGAGWAVFTVMAMIGGGMIPLAFMPRFMRVLSSVSPVKWGILALEGAIWRDFTMSEMLLPCAILLSVGLVAFTAGVRVLSRSDT